MNVGVDVGSDCDVYVDVGVGVDVEFVIRH